MRTQPGLTWLMSYTLCQPRCRPACSSSQHVLVVADEVAAHIEPRRALAVLMVVLARARAREPQVDQQVERAQQPLSAKTAIPTTKPKPKSAPVSDKPVCRFFLKPDGCKNGDNCQYAHPRTNGKCLRCGSESHNLQACTRPRRQQSSRSIGESEASFQEDLCQA